MTEKAIVPAKTREEVAIHEAGHAVVSLLFHYPFSAVTIEETDWYRGAVLPDEPNARRYRVSEDLFRCYLMDIVGLSAGEAAEGLQRNGTITMRFPEVTATDPALRGRMDDGTHLHRVAASLRLSTQTVVRNGLEIARAILHRPSIWSAAEAIRDLLLIGTTVSHADTKARFDSCVTTEDRQWADEALNNAMLNLQNSVFASWANETSNQHE